MLSAQKIGGSIVEIRLSPLLWWCLYLLRCGSTICCVGVGFVSPRLLYGGVDRGVQEAE